MRAIAVSYVNEYGFRIVTIHYTPMSVQLRLAELAREDVEAEISESAWQEAAPCHRPKVELRHRA